MVKRLGHGIIRTQIQHTDSVTDLTARRQNNHRRVIFRRAVRAQKAAPIPVGQHDIQQNQVVFTRLYKGRRVSNLSCVINSMAIKTNARRNSVRKLEIVFDQKVFHRARQLSLQVTGLCQVTMIVYRHGAVRRTATKRENKMKTLKMGRRALMATAIATFGLGNAAFADGHQVLDDIHFLIPGGAGGGWDGTARGTGEALTEAGLVGSASYENMSGGGGGVAIGYMIENAESLDNTLMVNSTPIVIRSLTGVFPHNFRDLTLVSGTIGDYAAIVVGKDSPINSMDDLLAAWDADQNGTPIGGGSVPGGMDHLVAAMVMEASGRDALGVNYIPYDAGGTAMAALLSGEIAALSTGFSEAVDLSNAGEVKIIGVTADERVDAAPDAMTMMEQGIDTTFVNWRGFFAAPGLADDKLEAYKTAIAAMYDTPEWEAVRARNGWVNIHNPGDEFEAFLEEQETVIGDLMRKLGFL